MAWITDEEFLVMAAQVGSVSSSAIRDAARDRATSVVRSYLRKRYSEVEADDYDPTPDVKGLVADLAAWFAIKVRGFNPQNGTDRTAAQTYTDALKLLEDIREGRAEIDTGIVDRRGPLIGSSEKVDWTYPPENCT